MYLLKSTKDQNPEGQRNWDLCFMYRFLFYFVALTMLNEKVFFVNLPGFITDYDVNEFCLYF